MATNEAYVYPQSSEYPIGKINYTEENDLTTDLTSGVTEQVDSYTDLKQGVYLLNTYCRIVATADASFNSMELDFPTLTNASVGGTSKFALTGKAFTDGQPCKFQFNEIINVTSNDNEIEVGFLPVYGAGDFELTDFTTNLMKLA
jgi:hypothetical protein